MAVYTKLSGEQLNDFFRKYNLGKLLNYKEIREGIENTNYFINTEKGKFILTLYKKRVDEKDLPFFISLMKNLFDKNKLEKLYIKSLEQTKAALKQTKL